jgi:hypothetical protein
MLIIGPAEADAENDEKLTKRTYGIGYGKFSHTTAVRGSPQA